MNITEIYHSTLTRQAKRQERELSPINHNVALTVLGAGLKATLETRANLSTNRFKVVSAPTGSSKTNSAESFAVSMWIQDPANFTCAFIVEEIATAQAIYESLCTELPPEVVGVWTSYHDVKMHRESDFVKYHFNPTLTTSEEVKDKPIVVYTHKRWLSENVGNALHSITPSIQTKMLLSNGIAPLNLIIYIKHHHTIR